MISKRHSIQPEYKFKRCVLDRKMGLFTSASKTVLMNLHANLSSNLTLWFRVLEHSWKKWRRTKKLLMGVLCSKLIAHKIWKDSSYPLTLKMTSNSWANLLIWILLTTTLRLNRCLRCFKNIIMAQKKNLLCLSKPGSRYTTSFCIFWNQSKVKRK